MSTAQSVASGHEQVMMELYSLLGSAESVGVHIFFFLHKLTHVHSLLIQIPTKYFLCFFFFSFSLNSICTLQLENLFFWYLRIQSSK